MTVQEIEISRLDKDNIPSDFAEALFKVADTGFKNGSPWTIKQIEETLGTDYTLVTYATIAHQVVGFIMASVTFDMADVFMVVVSADFKKRAIGTKLFDAFIGYCAEAEIHEIILEVRASNAPAIALYERVGFQTIGLRKAYYSSPIEDAIIMKRNIGEEKDDC